MASVQLLRHPRNILWEETLEMYLKYLVFLVASMILLFAMGGTEQSQEDQKNSLPNDRTQVMALDSAFESLYQIDN